MKHDYSNAINTIDQLLLDDSNMTDAQIRADLKVKGVDVDAYLVRFATELRKGFQRRQKRAVQEAATNLLTGACRVFGDLQGQSFEYLKAIYDKVKSGEYGPNLQEAAQARCRNQNGEEPSEVELRSWLEDISTSANQ
jgi:hypothetical protein